MGSGSGTDAFVGGAQAAYEKVLSSLIGTLAWPDLLVGPGSLGGAMVFGLEQVLIDVEIFRMSRYAGRGIPVSDELWLDDVLARVGPGGHFISEGSRPVSTPMAANGICRSSAGTTRMPPGWRRVGRRSRTSAGSASKRCWARVNPCRWAMTPNASWESCGGGR